MEASLAVLIIGATLLTLLTLASCQAYLPLYQPDDLNISILKCIGALPRPISCSSGSKSSSSACMLNPQSQCTIHIWSCYDCLLDNAFGFECTWASISGRHCSLLHNRAIRLCSIRYAKKVNLDKNQLRHSQKLFIMRFMHYSILNCNSVEGRKRVLS